MDEKQPPKQFCGYLYSLQFTALDRYPVLLQQLVLLQQVGVAAAGTVRAAAAEITAVE